MVNSTLKGCCIYYFGQHGDWSMEQVPNWIKNSSGKRMTALTNEVTHVLIPEKAWEKKTKLVGEVLDHKAKGLDFHILRYEWLDDSLRKTRRLKESKYSWVNADNNGKDKNGEPKHQAGLVKNLFTESTDGYVDEREKKQIEKQQAAEEKVRKEEEAAKKNEFEKKRDKLRVAEVAAVFRRGAQRGKVEILSDNHHIYMDATGFSYDIAMTKVDTKKNSNERYTLTIYASNSTPTTFAVSCQFAGTGKDKVNTIIAALGSTHNTALRAFKKIFKEKTKIEWEDRLKVAVERNKREKAGHVQLEAFADAPYLYYPPLYGSRGQIPKPPIVGQREQNVSEDIGGNMTNGGNTTISGGSQPTAEPMENYQDENFDFNRFMRETQDYAQQDTEDLVKNALEEPHEFGKPETYPSLDDEIGDGIQGHSFEYTQATEKAGEDFRQFIQDEATILGKRKYAGDETPEVNTSGKRLNTVDGGAEDNDLLPYPFDGIDVQEYERGSNELFPNGHGIDFSAFDVGVDGSSKPE